jgi:hypothetical protein
MTAILRIHDLFSSETDAGLVLEILLNLLVVLGPGRGHEVDRYQRALVLRFNGSPTFDILVLGLVVFWRRNNSRAGR